MVLRPAPQRGWQQSPYQRGRPRYTERRLGSAHGRPSAMHAPLQQRRSLALPASTRQNLAGNVVASWMKARSCSQPSGMPPLTASALKTLSCTNMRRRGFRIIRISARASSRGNSVMVKPSAPVSGSKICPRSCQLISLTVARPGFSACRPVPIAGANGQGFSPE